MTTNKMTNSSDYRSIFKSLTLFGGVQVLVILLGILRTKTIAMTVGAIGVGTLSMYTTIITLWYSIANLGISSSSVKKISEYFTSGDNNNLLKSIFSLNRLTFITAIIGGIFFAFSARFLSYLSFGNSNSQWEFFALSIVIIFESFNNRNQAVLQSFHKLKDLGLSTFIGNLIGTVISVLLYCLYGVKAIVPSLVILYFANYMCSQIFFRKCCIPRKKYAFCEINGVVADLVKMGIAMTISSILVYGSAYFIRLYIVKSGGLIDVGYYQAGWAIVNGYVGLIFTAMGKDYYPRLSAINTNNQEILDVSNKQIEFGLIILTPILVTFIIFVNLIISLLYTPDFCVISNMMIWSLFGMCFKLLSWSISYIFLAKGLARWFVIYEILGNIVTILFSLLFYYFKGLDGLGIAFLLSNIFYFFLVYFLARKVFLFKLRKINYRLLIINVLFASLAIFLTKIEFVFLRNFSVGIFLIVIYIIFFIELNKRLKFFNRNRL